MHSPSEFDVVTGAFSFTGSYIAKRLLDEGSEVATLTGHPDRDHPLQSHVEARELQFEDTDRLTAAMGGARTLYNTYWMRFLPDQSTLDRAVKTSKRLIQAAEDAGVERIVHVSITNPSRDAGIPYWEGKAVVEDAIEASSLSHAILRPAVIFGLEDILINNLAWTVRRFPVFPVPNDGAYEVRPIFVDDLACLAVEHGRTDDDVVLDAVGPEAFPFEELAHRVAESIGASVRTVPLPASVVLGLSRVIGRFVNDVVLSRDEFDAMREGLLTTDGKATGSTRLTEWLEANADQVGRSYTSELERHYRR